MQSAADLRDMLVASDTPVFAVLDGAQFPDLPGDLFDRGFHYRPLYRNNAIGDQDRVRTAPQLVWLDRRRATSVPDRSSQADVETGDDARTVDPVILDEVLALTAGRSGVAYWTCTLGGEALFRHLRGINMVLVPRSKTEDEEQSALDAEAAAAIEGEEADEARASDTATHEAVLFRHSDANVLAQILPNLGEVQLARFMGPANRVIYAPTGASLGIDGPVPVQELARQDGWPRPKPGLLQIEEHQYEAMRHARLARSRRRLMSYLRDCAPDDTADLDNTALHQQVLIAEKSGRELGLKSEAAHGQWAFLMLTTGGQIETATPVRRAISGAKDPDIAMTELMREMVKHSQADLQRSAGRV